MAKVFRLYNGNNTLVDWQNSVPYGTTAIDQILDPDASTAKKEITSIPSPFARMDLIKNAFAYVNRTGNLHRNTIFHKMVSDTLDVAQIFFQYERFKSKVDIIVWDKSQKLNELKQSSDSALKTVGETLSMYMDQDEKTYHFSKMKRMYILRYKGSQRHSEMDIIGATSPCTLFFSSANDLSYISNDIQFDQDKAFDGVYASLDQREDKFIEFIYAFRYSYPNFYKDFPEVSEYLDLVYKDGLNLNQKNIVSAINDNTIANFPELKISSDIVEINGVNFRRCPDVTDFKSGFAIDSKKNASPVPLVLPVKPGSIYQDIIYTNSPWGNTQVAPLKDANPLDKRTLPNVSINYPYLTIGDFLEDELIRVPKSNHTKDYAKNFFNGNVENDSDSEYEYLLPLKSAFFDYFTPEDLNGKLYGQKMIEISHLAGGSVQVILRIPIQNRKFIEYEKVYVKGQPILENQGQILTKEFGIALFSNIKYTNDNDAFYRIGLISDYPDNDDYSLKFYKDDVVINSEVMVRNDNLPSYDKCKTYIVEHSNFDYIKVLVEGRYEGLIIPIFIKQGGTDVYTFAIDLGTTNTHVEYSINGRSPQPLDIDENNSIVKLWGNIPNTSKFILDYDLFPQGLGSDQLCKFPMRTVLSESKNTNWNQATYALGQVNIPFPYEKKYGYDYNRISTDLKWSTDKNISAKVQMYIESLFLVLRNKVLSNYGDLASTKIVWFYPISMVNNRYNMFKNLWRDSYVKYFGGETDNIIPLTESVAPYNHYKHSVPNASNMVTVDIGGGTSDIVIANDDDIKCITSFRFAADAIFGDAYATSSKAVKNALVQTYIEDIKKVLADNNLNDLCQILDDHVEMGNSSNLASFFFSLKNNSDVTSDSVRNNLDFSKILQSNDNYKLVFVFFYSAIIYHLAKIMYAKNLDMPRHIAFSGNGSRVISILSPDKKTLCKFTKLIFEKVYGTSYPSDGLDLLQEEKNPKEVTCKGGLLNPKAQDYSEIDDLKVVLKSINNESFISTEKYKDIDDKYIDECVEEAKTFIKFVLGLNESFSFKKYFGVTEKSLELANRECFRDLKTFTKNGLSSKKREVSDNDNIEETMFFYPLTGMLYALGTAIKNAK